MRSTGADCMLLLVAKKGFEINSIPSKVREN